MRTLSAGPVGLVAQFPAPLKACAARSLPRPGDAARSAHPQGRGELRGQPRRVSRSKSSAPHGRRSGARGTARATTARLAVKEFRATWQTLRGAGNCAGNHDESRGQRAPRHVADVQGRGELRGRPRRVSRSKGSASHGRRPGARGTARVTTARPAVEELCATWQMLRGAGNCAGSPHRAVRRTVRVGGRRGPGCAAPRRPPRPPADEPCRCATTRRPAAAASDRAPPRPPPPARPPARAEE